MPSKKEHKPVPRKNMSRPLKRQLWLKHFLDESNPDTFLNATASVKAAKYKCNGDPSCNSLGHENFRYHEDSINEWLEKNGLSENALKIKLLSLLEAKETKFFQHEGMVTDEREVEAIETQRRTLDMAFKARGLYEKHQNQGAATIVINSTDIKKPKNAGTGKGRRENHDR